MNAAPQQSVVTSALQRTRSLKLRGLPTAWLEDGPGKRPLILFLHGYPDCPGVWDPQVAELSKDFECVRPFSRGLLPTDEKAPSSRYHLDSQLLDLLEIVNEKTALANRPVYIVGHDLGGVLALHLAPLLGARLKGTVIFNSASLPQMLRRYTDWEQILKSWYLFGFQLPKLPELFISQFPQKIMEVKKSIPGLRDLALSQSQLTRPLQSYRAFFREAIKHWNAPPPRLNSPLLVLWGNKDPFLVPPTWEEWQPVSDDVTFRILEGGHWLQWEKTDMVNGFLRNFLSELE